MAKAVDIGTSFVVGGRLERGKEVFTLERDAFFSMPREDLAEELLNDAGAKYILRGDEIFIVGGDALKYCMITGREEEYRRPLARGVLNPGEEEAIPLIELLVEGVVGRADVAGEIIAATIPSAPLDLDQDVVFHRIIVERLLKRLGYEVRILNEALAIIYAENPTVVEEGAEVPFTGVGLSFGAGMTNLVLTWRGKSLFELSVARGGDWIDQSVARVRNVPVGRVTHEKETGFALDRDTRDGVHLGLQIYYEELVRHVLGSFGDRFRSAQVTVSQPLDVVIAGGTAAVPGFVPMFQRCLEEVGAPVPVQGVRLARDPLRCVARGALVAAVSAERRRGPLSAPTSQPTAPAFVETP